MRHTMVQPRNGRIRLQWNERAGLRFAPAWRHAGAKREPKPRSQTNDEPPPPAVLPILPWAWGLIPSADWEVCEKWQMQFKFAGLFAKLDFLPLRGQASADRKLSCPQTQPKRRGRCPPG